MGLLSTTASYRASLQAFLCFNRFIDITDLVDEENVRLIRGPDPSARNCRLPQGVSVGKYRKHRFPGYRHSVSVRRTPSGYPAFLGW